METGSVNDREHHRKRTVTHEKNFSVISRMIEENNGEISTRQLALDTNMSRSSVMKVLKDRKLFPYKKRYVHEMRPGDPVERLVFYLKAKEMVKERLFVRPLLVFSDEAYFHLTGHINKQNDRVWATSKSITPLPRPVFAKKIRVWAALSSKKIYKPIFFEGSLDSSRYIDEVIEVFMAEVKKDNEDISYIVFQQDGASCHAFIATMSHLKSIFGRTNIVSRNSDFKWSARSPYLNPLDLYL